MAGVVATATTTIEAGKDAVWKALTDPEEVKKYMMGSQVETDWKPGSPIVWKGEWEGKPFEDTGEILAVDEPNRLEITHFSPLTGQPDEPGSYHALVYTLEDKDGGTEVTLTQDNNGDKAEADRNASNWSMVLEGLKKAVEGG